MNYLAFFLISHLLCRLAIMVGDMIASRNNILLRNPLDYYRLYGSMSCFRHNKRSPVLGKTAFEKGTGRTVCPNQS